MSQCFSRRRPHDNPSSSKRGMIFFQRCPIGSRGVGLFVTLTKGISPYDVCFFLLLLRVRERGVETGGQGIFDVNKEENDVSLPMGRVK